MERLKEFLKSTQLLSRMLVGLWLVAVLFSNDGCKVIVVWTFLFLLPAIVIEFRMNQVVKAVDFRLIVFISSIKIVSWILFGLWSLISVTLLFSGMDLPEFLSMIGVSSLIFLLPACIIEYQTNPCLEKLLASRRRKRIERYISKSRIGAIVCLIPCLMGTIAYLQNPIDDPAAGNQASGNLSVAIVFGLLTVILFVISLNAPKTKVEAMERAKAKKVRKEEKRQQCKREQATFIRADSVEQTRQRNPEWVRCDAVGSAEQFVDPIEDEIEEPDKTDITYVDGMEGHEFEYFCADLLRRHGFVNVSVTPGSGDQGVDVLAEKEGVKYAVQCKNYASPLSNTPVQEVNAGKMFYRCHVGVVMTNSTFTPRAMELAEATGVLLWGRDVVQDMMKQ